MAQGANIVINDGAVTPVAVTFYVKKASPELTLFKDQRLVGVNRWPEITLSADLPAASAKLRKAKYNVAYPVVDAVTGLVTDIGRARVEFDIPTSMAQTDINNLYAFVQNGVANALIKGAIRDQDTIIG